MQDFFVFVSFCGHSQWLTPGSMLRDHTWGAEGVLWGAMDECTMAICKAKTYHPHCFSSAHKRVSFHFLPLSKMLALGFEHFIYWFYYIEIHSFYIQLRFCHKGCCIFLIFICWNNNMIFMFYVIKLWYVEVSWHWINSTWAWIMIP